MTRNEAAVLARMARAKNIPPLDIRFWSKVEKGKDHECWPWIACVRNKQEGYGAFWYQGRHHPAPRIAYFLGTGEFVTDLQICHRCDNPSCCNPAHLFLGTGKQNNDDKVEKGRHAYGEKCANSILNEESVRKIRSMRATHTACAIAEIFGVDYTTISDVCRRKSWNHVI